MLLETLIKVQNTLKSENYNKNDILIVIFVVQLYLCLLYKSLALIATVLCLELMVSVQVAACFNYWPSVMFQTGLQPLQSLLLH